VKKHHELFVFVKRLDKDLESPSENFLLEVLKMCVYSLLIEDV